MAESAQEDGDDGALVLAVQRGDAEAFATLYRRHYPAVRRACERRLFDAHEADEVAQATFVRAFERIDQCAGERRFGPWVHVIARSLCVDFFRATARVELLEEPLAGGGRDHRPNEPEESLLHQERAAQVQEALASLPDRQRRAVIARDWEGLRPGEIADRLGLSVSAVDSLLLRARRRLALSYRRLAGEAGGGANTRPVRWAAAAVAMAVALGPQSVMTASAAAAHAVQDTAERAAGGVMDAVVSVALTLGGVPATPPEPVPEQPPAVAAVVPFHDNATPAARTPDARPPSVANVPADPAPAERAVDRLTDPPVPVTSSSTVPAARPRAVAPPAPASTTTTLPEKPAPPASTDIGVDLPLVSVPATSPTDKAPPSEQPGPAEQPSQSEQPAPAGPAPPSDSVKVTAPPVPALRDITLPTLPLG